MRGKMRASAIRRFGDPVDPEDQGLQADSARRQGCPRPGRAWLGRNAAAVAASPKKKNMSCALPLRARRLLVVFTEAPIAEN